jgi:hypothetical protein
MQIQEITASRTESVENKAFTSKPAVKKNKNFDAEQSNSQTASTAWQKNILMDAISSLENNIQMDNTHPLSMSINAPIESFSEAMIELSFTKTQKFQKEASFAQANIDINNVLTLLMYQ